jgi:BASS family bile acid:Na+ symporter
MRLNDLILIILAMAGIAGGVAFPGPSSFFSPFVIYFMMTILFLAFLTIDFAALVRIRGADLGKTAVWVVMKLVAMPLAVWLLCLWLAPSLALPALLLTGVSTGVTAPFFSNLVGADTTRVLQLTVITSLLVPISLPALVQFLAGAEMNIPYWHMVRMLLQVIFIPLAIAMVVKRFMPRLLILLNRARYWVSVIFFFIINLGVFSAYSGFILAHQAQVTYITLAAFLLAGLYTFWGFALGLLSGRRLNGLTGAVGMTYINNVLIVVFAAEFFGPDAPLLAAAYLLPYFFIIIPMRWAKARLSW